MNLSNWKLFDKHGSPINWYADAYLNLNFATDVSSNSASGYLITDSSATVVDSKITNSGIYYYDPTTVTYDYIFGETGIDITSDVSILYVDVSIFNPDFTLTQGIGSLTNIDVSGNFIYPSTVYSSAVFLRPVSQGLIETEHIYIFEEFSGSLYRPYDVSTSQLVVRMVGEEDEIQLFTVDEDTETVTWTDEIIFELDEWVASTPLTLNIGFKSDEEGVYERKMRIYNVVDGIYYTMGEILVNAESIGEDERFRALLSNFGLPDPKDFPTLFKEADINEDLPDYEIVNPKSKHMILEHDKIIPFIGTYKALINAIKWLGYEDIYVREWFKNVKENTKLSLIVPYDAADRTQTILKFSAEERQALKKLNQLSLNYCITRETGEIDDWGTPLTENCYEYNIEEVFVKLVALKKWLEKNIIGVNARIIDITGEGVYFERYINLTWSTDLVGFDYSDYQSLTPYTTPNFSELIEGESSINLTLLEYSKTKLGEQKNTIGDYINYIWDPNDSSVTLSPDDPSYLANPNAYLAMGPPLSHPFVGIEDIQWKASVSKPVSGVIPETHVTNPLWIYNNEIKFYNIYDSSSVFYDSSVNLSIQIETGYLRDASNNVWTDSIEYSVYPNEYIRVDASTVKVITYPGDYIISDGSGIVYYDRDSSIVYNSSTNPTSFTMDVSAAIYTDTSTLMTSPLQNGYVLESSTGEKWEFDNFVNLMPDTSSLLEYALDDKYRVPLLSLKNWKSIDARSVEHTFNKYYHLDIVNGRISIDNIDPSVGEDVRQYIDFNYDTSQNINLNVEYVSPRMSLYVIDPSTYYWADPSGLSGGDSSLVIDNSIYTMTVNHIGDYNIEVFAWDGYNVLYTNSQREPHDVFVKNPTIYTIIDNGRKYPYYDSSISVEDVSTIISQNTLPIFDRDVPYLGLTLEYDSSNNVYINIPAISFFQNLPEIGTLTKYDTTSEEIENISGSDVTVVKLYQDFSASDNIILIKVDKGSYTPIIEASSYISAISGVNNQTLTLDNIPAEFVLDTSHSIYVINDTLRYTSNASNDSSTSFSIDVSNYTFLNNQLVNLLVTDTSTDYQWGSSYRVTDVSGDTHTFNNTFSQFIIDASDRYTIEAKHAYSSYANYEMIVTDSSEVNNNFVIYQDDYRQYTLDNTFNMTNILFSYDYVNDQWYDTSLNLVTSPYFLREDPVEIKTDKLLILKSYYDSSTYLLNQKNIWTIKENISKDIVFRVFNENVPFVFDTSGYYDVIAESYDSYGNLGIRTYEGLIHVV